MPRPVLIHPGYHKTGTTYLQEVLFADEQSFAQPWPRNFLYKHVIDPHELAFDDARARQQFADKLSAVPDAVIPVLSEEGLCGNPFNGAREAAILARKLRAIFDDAYVLLTVRRQAGMLRAVYIQYLKAYGRLSPDKFYDPPRYPEFAAFDPDVFQYDRLASAYASLFGADKVLVLPQELLHCNEPAFLAAIGKHIGMTITAVPRNNNGTEDRNVSPSPAGVPFLRLGNHFSSSAFNESGFAASLARFGTAFRSLGYRKTPFFRSKVEEFEQLIDRFEGRYTSSNARLQAFCPFDLGKLGYEMP